MKRILRKSITIRLPIEMVKQLEQFKDQEGGYTGFIEIAIQSRLSWYFKKNPNKVKQVTFGKPEENPQRKEVSDEEVDEAFKALFGPKYKSQNLKK